MARLTWASTSKLTLTIGLALPAIDCCTKRIVPGAGAEVDSAAGELIAAEAAVGAFAVATEAAGVIVASALPGVGVGEAGVGARAVAVSFGALDATCVGGGAGVATATATLPARALATAFTL